MGDLKSDPPALRYKLPPLSHTDGMKKFPGVQPGELSSLDGGVGSFAEHQGENDRGQVAPSTHVARDAQL